MQPKFLGWHGIQQKLPAIDPKNMTFLCQVLFEVENYQQALSNLVQVTMRFLVADMQRIWILQDVYFWIKIMHKMKAVKSVTNRSLSWIQAAEFGGR